jgi:hypothetical protein
MTFRVSEEKNVIALGKDWATACSTKIELSREEDADGRFIRSASLVKSQLTTQWNKIRFRITVTQTHFMPKIIIINMISSHLLLQDQGIL